MFLVVGSLVRAASIYIVDNNDNTGRYSSIAALNGNPVISYYTTNGMLKVASCNDVACSTDNSTIRVVDTSEDGRW